MIPLRNQFEELERRVGYHFRDPGLLEHALTHTSRANEDVSGGVFDNESLEFLGDAVLGFAIADLLFRRFPERDEGWKSKIKATLVSTTSWRGSRKACTWASTSCSDAERKKRAAGGSRHCSPTATKRSLRRSISTAASSWHGVHRAPVCDPDHQAREPEAVFRDFKSTLQERVQSGGDPLPEYVLSETGPDHSRRFRLKCVSRAGRLQRREAGARRKQNRKPHASRCNGSARPLNRSR